MILFSKLSTLGLYSFLLNAVPLDPETEEIIDYDTTYNTSNSAADCSERDEIRHSTPFK
jgi:hypothetical protein